MLSRHNKPLFFRLTFFLILSGLLFLWGFSSSNFSYAQRGPSFEVCKTPPCYPKVENFHLVQDDNGIEPTNHAYKRGSVLRIHAQITDPGGVYSAKAYIREMSTGNQKVVIPLYDDGSSFHGDDLKTKQNTQTKIGSDGADDNIYSNKWFASFYLKTNTRYCVEIVAIDNFGNTYSSAEDTNYNPSGCNSNFQDGEILNECQCEIIFTVQDFCLANCSQEGESRCSNNTIENCVFNEKEGCYSWKSSGSCSPYDCCGIYEENNPNSIYCCNSSAPDCAFDNSRCLNCDHSCNGYCNTSCSPADDPDCKFDETGQVVGGNACCGNGVCESQVSEDTATCLKDCPDYDPPTAFLVSPSGDSVYHNNSEQVFIQIQISDISGVAPAPVLYFIDSSGSIFKTFVLFDDGETGGDSVDDDGIYSTTVIFDNSWSFGNYTLGVVAHDNSPQDNFNSSPQIVGTISIVCFDQCSKGETGCANDKVISCHKVDDCWLWDTDNPQEDCSVASLGGQCYIDTNNEAQCCVNECDPNAYPQCVNNSATYCKRNPTTGCYVLNAISCDSQLCVFDEGGEPFCCPADSCIIGEKDCQGDELKTCQRQGSSCPVWQGNDCMGSEVCRYQGGDPTKPYCCINQCQDNQIGIASLCSSDNKQVLNCDSNNSDCNTTSLNQDCFTPTTTHPFGGRCYQVGTGDNSAQCCYNECNPATYIPQCSGAQITECRLNDATGCYIEVTTDCSDSDTTCVTVDIGGGQTKGSCCSISSCVLGEKQCNGDTLEECQTDIGTSCNEFKSLSCPGGQVCRDPDDNPDTKNSNCCEENCSHENSYYCDGNILKQCLKQDDGCLRGIARQDCTSLGQVCRINNNSTPADNSDDFANCCQNFCSENQTQCADTNSDGTLDAIEVCQIQSNGCWGWGSIIQNCDVDNSKTCHIGANGPNCCQDACSSGEQQCVDVDGDGILDEIQICQLNNSTGCYEWAQYVSCNPGDQCYSSGTDSSGVYHVYPYCDKADTSPPAVYFSYPFVLTERALSYDAYYESKGNKAGIAVVYNGEPSCPYSLALTKESITEISHFSDKYDYAQSDGGYGEYYHFCFLLNNGNVHCVADDSHILSDYAKDYLEGDAVGVATGRETTCILTSNGNVQCQGDNYWGQAEDYTGGDAVGVAAEGVVTCILKSDGNVDCRGGNNFGQAEDYTGGDAVGVATSGYHTCALLNNGNVHCWGENDFGQAEDYTGGDAVGVKTVYSNSEKYTCALLNNGNVHCWGCEQYNLNTCSRFSSDVIRGDIVGMGNGGNLNGYFLTKDGNISNGSRTYSVDNGAVWVGSYNNAVCVVKSNGDIECRSGSSYTSWEERTISFSYSNGNAYVVPMLNFFENAPYSSFGVYTSPVLDVSHNNQYNIFEFNKISWTENKPSGTDIVIKIRSSDNSSMSTSPDWSVCSPVSNNQDISANNCVNDRDKYIQWQAILTSENSSITPSLQCLVVYFSDLYVVEKGDIVVFNASIIDQTEVNSATAQLYIQRPDGVEVASLNLYDDGDHNDGYPKNNYYGTIAFDTSSLIEGVYYIDIFAEDIVGNGVTVDNIGMFEIK